MCVFGLMDISMGAIDVFGLMDISMGAIDVFGLMDISMRSKPALWKVSWRQCEVVVT